MNKSLITNLIALALTIAGYFSPIYGQIIFITGAFALSGGVTNWIAVYMLFERIPFIYGSGVIPNRFEDFKAGIKNLIIDEFFNKEHIEKFFAQNASVISDEGVNKKIDFDKVFQGLVEAILESPMGGMLGMFGGAAALDPLKEPIINKLKGMITQLVEGDVDSKGDITQNIISKIEEIIDNRLRDLTPQMVKDIIQKMIRQHLGWLVVWGGVFGGLIGLVCALFGLM
jgi:uncharacterized membrane protein YheB (UPF0754 family)